MALFTDALFSAFDTANTVFGDPVSWDTAPGGIPVIGTALFAEPDGKAVLTPHGRNTDGAEYQQAEPTLEYRAGQFTGLRELALVPGSAHTITLTQSGRRFMVGNVKRIHDGNVLLATLEEIF